MSFIKPIKHYYTDLLHKKIYATDASVYREIPHAVAYPENTEDIIRLIKFAHNQNLNLTPRAAGTSLGGQCVTSGIVMDVSRYMTNIIDFNPQQRTIRVQPGVIRDTLNDFLRPYGLFFSPNTSTSNRCTIGGMTGNNSAGSTSIKYGVTRDKILGIKAVLSDGSQVEFSPLTPAQWERKRTAPSLEGKIYNSLHNILSNPDNRKLIIDNFPHPSIHRRNTGYALDALLEARIFGGNSDLIPIQKLLAGSEGTLAIFTEIQLQLDPLPPKHNRVIAAHFDSLEKALKAVPVSMKHDLYMCELMDDVILKQTKNNRTQSRNRFFIQGEPAAILLLEVASHSQDDSLHRTQLLIDDIMGKDSAYACPVLQGDEITKALELRAAGLGLLGNIVGDTKAVACVEDTAVQVEKLPQYIADFKKMMREFNQQSVYFAHAGAGELHLRPMLNLKKKKEVIKFKDITYNTAALVKKYKGSMSGEHGDGRVRSELIPLILGKETYQFLIEIKESFDPENIFNPGKIVHPVSMIDRLRYEPDRTEPVIKTKLDFTDSLGILRVAEKCNGSGDCRKLPTSGGVMCPSYRASREEQNTTRARANALREFLTHSTPNNPFDHDELYDIFDLCLSCKACASECPSNVDVASLKAEFLYQYQKIHGVPLRSRIIAYNAKLNKLGSRIPAITNRLLKNKNFKKLLGLAQERRLPELQPVTFSRWLKKQQKQKTFSKRGTIYLFVDEFTNYYDVETGKKAYELLLRLGYEIKLAPHKESGRAYISKGMLDEAEKIAEYNVSLFSPLIDDNTPLVGIEPSAVLVFKDEYKRLTGNSEQAAKLADNVYTFEGFLAREFSHGRISSGEFHNEKKSIYVHGHCHQKSLTGIEEIKTALSIPINYHVEILQTGCCGMAGAFGYEQEHYSFSMKVGETEVFPKVRQLKPTDILAVSGTSCRHQIEEGTSRHGIHTADILLKALKTLDY